VGNVSAIGFVAGKYDQHAVGYRYVYVECTLDKNLFDGLQGKVDAERVKDEVVRGLRARTISQGLTGQLYLGLDYVDPERNPPLPINWEPDNIYIPSAPSTLSRLESAVLGISNTLEGLDDAELPEAVKSFRRFADSASTFLDSSDLRGWGPRLSATLDQTRTLLARINVLLADPAVETLLPETAKAVTGVRKLVDAAGPDAKDFAREAKETAQSLKVSAKRLEALMTNPETEKQLAEMPGTLKQARETVSELRTAAGRLNQVMGRVQNLTATQQANVEGILENARQLIENLRELTGEAKRNPSGMIFGAPPEKSPLERR
jgi:paraquat-inducible protein B